MNTTCTCYYNDPDPCLVCRPQNILPTRLDRVAESCENMGMTMTDDPRDALDAALARRLASYAELVPAPDDAPPARRNLRPRNRRSVNRRYGMNAKIK